MENRRFIKSAIGCRGLTSKQYTLNGNTQFEWIFSTGNQYLQTCHLKIWLGLTRSKAQQWPTVCDIILTNNCGAAVWNFVFFPCQWGLFMFRCLDLRSGKESPMIRVSGRCVFLSALPVLWRVSLDKFQEFFASDADTTTTGSKAIFTGVRKRRK